MHVTIRGPFKLVEADRDRLWPLTMRGMRMRWFLDEPTACGARYVEALTDRGEVAGWALVTRKPGRAAVIDVFVAPRWRRRGFGTLLAVAAKHAAARLWPGRRAMVTPHSEAGRRCYRSAGLVRRCP